MNRADGHSPDLAWRLSPPVGRWGALPMALTAGVDALFGIIV